MSVAVGNWAGAAEMAPASVYSSEEWLKYWNDNPDVLFGILGDLYRVYKHEQLKEAGKAPRAGRRKLAIDGNLDELFDILTPRFSMKPFPEAFRDVQGQRSLRQVALRSGYTHRTLGRWLEPGSYPKTQSGAVNRDALEAVARALKVHPAYFLEWRNEVILELVTSVCNSSPNLSVKLLKGLAR